LTIDYFFKRSLGKELQIMSKPAIKEGDQVIATDMHTVIVQVGLVTQTESLPHPFNGIVDGSLSATVFIMGKPAATTGSTATNVPPHTPTPPGTSFQIPPTNQAIIQQGSRTVFINGHPAARAGDETHSCADPAPNVAAELVSTGSSVFIGD
jgi:uncharacterized Zn-binding protein involved in type VI secretion